MVTLLLDSARLELELSPTERALSQQKAQIRIPRDQIEKVQLTDDPWTWLRGVRKPGTYLSGVVAAGIWHSLGGSDLVLIRGRKPGVVVDLASDAEFQRLVLTTRHGLALAQALRLDISDPTPTDVTRIVPDRTPARKRRARPATA